MTNDVPIGRAKKAAVVEENEMTTFFVATARTTSFHGQPIVIGVTVRLRHVILVVTPSSSYRKATAMASAAVRVRRLVLLKMTQSQIDAERGDNA